LAAFIRLHHFLLKKPTGLLPEFEPAAQFAATDTILIGRNIIDDIKGLKKREFTVVKKGACIWGL